MRAACFVLVLIASAGTALGQAPSAPPTTAPAASPGSSPSTTPAAPAAAPTAVPPAPPPAAQPGPEQPAVPPPPPEYATPAPSTEPPPPPPAYKPLGAKPEPEIEKGDWDPWEHTGDAKHHHDGFMLRLAIGLGFGGVGGKSPLADEDEIALAGLGLNFNVGIGGALTENLVLNADLFQATFFHPKVEVDGDDRGRADELAEDRGVGEDTELTGIGVGVTYYLMPANVYFAGSLGIGKVIFVNGSGDRGGSDVGFAANVMIGKEWWVGVDWGIGVAGQLIVIAAEDDFLDEVGGVGFGLMFSATYN